MKLTRMERAGHVTRKDDTRNAYEILVRNPEWKSQPGRPKRIQEYNIKLDPKVI